MTHRLTIQHAQDHQPWTVPYSDAVLASGVPHILASHTVLHAIKSLGKMATVFEALDHSGAAMNSEQQQTVMNMSADLLTAALRFANLYKFDLASVLVNRIREKNGVELEPWI